jgi:hypothetical protein
LDIETAPHKVYAWGLHDVNIGINQIVEPGYTLCWAAKWRGRSEVLFGSSHRHGQKQMVRSVHKLLDECDAVVHFNGRNFDVPTLNKEFLLHDLPPPAPFKHVDLLWACRQLFKFASNKLDYLAQALGEGAKVEHKGMDLWRGCMAGDEASWRIMERYNRHDVRLTERLYERLLPWLPNHPNHGQFHEGEGAVCPRCGSDKLQRRGVYRAAVHTYARHYCKSCGAWSRGRNLLPYEPKPELVAA